MSESGAARSSAEPGGGAGPGGAGEAPPTWRVLSQELGEALIQVSDACGDLVITLRREALLRAAELCRDHPELQYDYLMDIATVDYLGQEPRFEVVYNLYSTRRRHRVRIRVRVPEDDPVVDSLYALWPAADWFEREGWDLMGIRFRGHPRLTRILTHPEFVGHPLRKDYPIERRQPLIGPQA